MDGRELLLADITFIKAGEADARRREEKGGDVWQKQKLKDDVYGRNDEDKQNKEYLDSA